MKGTKEEKLALLPNGDLKSLVNTEVHNNGFEVMGRRIKKGAIFFALGVIFVLLVRAIVRTPSTISSTGQRNGDDTLFSAMLFDDKGFYFPSLMPTSKPASRRTLKETMRSISKRIPDMWCSYDWTQNVEASAAIGEYYRAKGRALEDTYKSKYDPVYNPTSSDASTKTAPASQQQWTYDWHVDRERGIALGEKYKAIGEAIDEHYRQLYDPTYFTVRHTPFHDWQTDRDRGIAIGRYYKELAWNIKQHYIQKYSPASTYATQGDWESRWKAYEAKGRQIAKYYSDKGISIGRFYEDKYGVRSRAVGSEDRNGDTNNNDQVYVWGLDWRDDKEHAIAIHKDMMKKGVAIGDYYRAKFDPTYRKDRSAEDKNPSRGEDPEAEEEQDQTIGEYYKAHGKAIGRYYKERGKEIGKYFEDYYRGLFDPTYNATVDLNW